MTEANGRLGDLPEARPYLQARGRLAEMLSWQEDGVDDAIAEYQELLRLDGADLLRMREPLLGLLLQTRRFAEARGLLMRYEGDSSSAWIYGQALLEFEKHAEAAKWTGPDFDEVWLEGQLDIMRRGEIPEIPFAVREADQALIKALEHNPWGAICLLKSEEFRGLPMPMPPRS